MVDFFSYVCVVYFVVCLFFFLMVVPFVDCGL